MRFKNSLFWLIALSSFLLDQLSKYWIVTNFKIGDFLPLWLGVFHITYINSGAAFSLFSQSTAWLRWYSLAISLALVALACLGPRLSRWEQAGYGYFLAGTLGNSIDRFFRDGVVVFLDLRVINFPVFNLADIFINVGIVCLIIASLWNKSNFARGNSRNPL